ncbi:hypothetical protein FVE85_3646 [Porphyridium purpureum]|uniref:VOC domain-containing protein n=1 Tax=Porphyridium purpureum TaxID=35688 RepID=A0A5J4YLT2_PORPP|nr:hypothetical protein FVE85_3646 [Porphyridium purpureum]|eukprot:POR8119..scf249_10
MTAYVGFVELLGGRGNDATGARMQDGTLGAARAARSKRVCRFGRLARMRSLRVVMCADRFGGSFQSSRGRGELEGKDYDFSRLQAGAPKPEDPHIPVNLRRTTLVVSDLDLSLKFYEEGLGMTRIFENRIVYPHSAKDESEAKRVGRLVFLKCNHSFIGVLGLYQYLKPIPRQIPEIKDAGVFHGCTFLMFSSFDSVDDRIERMLKVPGTSLAEEPELMQYPGYAPGSTIFVRKALLRDPDGIFVEINQVLNDF